MSHCSKTSKERLVGNFLEVSFADVLKNKLSYRIMKKNLKLLNSEFKRISNIN